MPPREDADADAVLAHPHTTTPRTHHHPKNTPPPLLGERDGGGTPSVSSNAVAVKGRRRATLMSLTEVSASSGNVMSNACKRHREYDCDAMERGEVRDARGPHAFAHPANCSPPILHADAGRRVPCNWNTQLNHPEKERKRKEKEKAKKTWAANLGENSV